MKIELDVKEIQIVRHVYGSDTVYLILNKAPPTTRTCPKTSKRASL